MKLIDRLSFDMLAQNRSRRLADRTALAIEKGFLDFSGIIKFQLKPNLIAAERVFLAVSTRRTRDVPFVVRAFVMVEDVIVVKLFVHFGTDKAHFNSANGLHKVILRLKVRLSFEFRQLRLSK